MIVDLIKNGEYRAFGIVTFIKDYLTVFLGLSIAVIAILTIWSGILFVNAFRLFYDWFWFGVTVRSLVVLSFLPAMVFHKRSHILEKQKHKLK